MSNRHGDTAVLRNTSEPTGSSSEAFIVKLSWPWRLIGPTFFIVAAAYPFLVTFIELRRLDRGDIAPPFLILGAAVWFSQRYSHWATVNEKAVTFHSLFKAVAVPWSNIKTFEVSGEWLLVTDHSRRRYRVNTHAQSIDLLAEQLRDRINKPRGA